MHSASVHVVDYCGTVTGSSVKVQQLRPQPIWIIVPCQNNSSSRTGLIRKLICQCVTEHSLELETCAAGCKSFLPDQHCKMIDSAATFGNSQF